MGTKCVSLLSSRNPRMIKKIKHRVKFENGKILDGLVYLDRWGENLWFETPTKLYTPIEIEKSWDLSFTAKLNLYLAAIYTSPLTNLIPPNISILKRRHERH